MLVHVVAFRWKAGVEQEKIESIMAEIASLEDKIDGIEVSVGENISPVASHLTHAIVVRASSDQAFDTYLSHPDHLAVAEAIGQAADEALVLDFHDDRS